MHAADRGDPLVATDPQSEIFPAVSENATVPPVGFACAPATELTLAVNVEVAPTLG